jgi:hypothetical protein
VVYENPQSYTSSFGLISTSGTSFTINLGFPLDATNQGNPITIAGTPYSVSTVAGGGMSGTLTSSAGAQTNVGFFVGGAGTFLGPAHSITAVVEGGVNSDIGLAIYTNRGVGCMTSGATTVTVADPLNPAITMPISFDALGYVQVYVVLSVHALAGFTSATQAAIQTAVVNYLNSLGIGQNVVFSEIYGAALSARPNPDQPLFSIRSGQIGAALATTTATLSTSSPTITAASSAGIANGQIAAGAGIPNNTTVTAVSGTSVTLSANPTANGSAVPVSFFSPSTSDLAIGFNQAAQGIAINVVVNLV